MNEEENKTVSNKDIPVLSHYSQIRGDIWDAYHQYTMVFAHIVGLEQVQKINGKEYRNYQAQAVDFALQFYGKVMSCFPKTWGIIESDELIRRKKVMSPGELDEWLATKGTLTQNYFELMNRFNYGDPIINKKGVLMKYSPHVASRAELAFILELMNQFIYHSGIGKIEGRFSDKDEYDEPVMRA